MDWALRNPIKLILCTDVAANQRNLNGFCLSAIQLQKSFIYIQESGFFLFRINSFLFFHLPFFPSDILRLFFLLYSHLLFIYNISPVWCGFVFFFSFSSVVCFFHASYLEFDRSMTSITFFYSIELTPRKKKWRKIRRQMSRILKKET